MANLYAVYNKATGEMSKHFVAQRTAILAWEYFKEHATDVKWGKVDGCIARDRASPFFYKNFYECRMLGTRAPVLRRSGHRLSVTWNGERGAESVHAGTCTCGWTESSRTKVAMQYEFIHHIKQLNTADAIPQPPARLPASKRVQKSIEKMKSEGGERKTFRLPEIALKELNRMVEQENFPTQTAAVEALLTRRATPAFTASSQAIYPLHVDDRVAETVIDDAVRLACRELDKLFPGVSPDGGKGVSSNFQGLLVDHVKAMLTGLPHARRTHHVSLPPLLADDNVFGQEFSLPDVPGAGYIVVSPIDSRVLSAYSGRFMPVYGGLARDATGARIIKLTGDNDEALNVKTAPRDYVGRELFFQSGAEPDILFATFEAARGAALKALYADDLSPAEMHLKILAGQYNGETERFAFI